MLRRLFRPLLIAAVVLFLATGSFAAVLSRTDSGRGLLMDEALSRIRGSISGDVQVAGIRSSSGLLRGVTLDGIRVTDSAGGSVMTADSVRASYSLISLLTRRFVSRITVFSPVVTVQRMDSGGWNVLELLQPPVPDSVPVDDVLAHDSATGPIVVDTSGVGLRPVPEGGYELDRLDIVDGVVRVAREGGRGDDRWMTYDGIDARMNDLRLGAAGGGDRADIDRLAATAHFEQGDLEILHLRGFLRRDEAGMRIEGEELQLADSRGQGAADFDWSGPDGMSVQLALDVESLAFADLGWLGLPFPTGRTSGRLEATVRPGGETTWSISDLSASADGSRARGSVGFVTGRAFRFTDVDLRLDPLDRDVLRTWLTEEVSERLPDRFVGTFRAEGPPTALQVFADLSLESVSLDPSRVELSGRILGGTNPGVEAMRVRSESMAFPTLSRLAGLETVLPGVGSLDVELEGRVRDGLSIAGHISRQGDLGGSTARVDGRFRRMEDDSWSGLGSVGLRPLLLAHIDPLFPTAQLKGTAVGEVTFQGNLHSLRVSTDLQTSGGPLMVEGVVDAVHPAAGVTVSGFIEGLDLAALSGRVPQPTLVRGEVALEDLRTVGPSPVGSAHLNLEDSRVGSLDIESLHVTAVAADGILSFDSLRAETSIVDVQGSGALPLTEEGPDGEVRIAVRTESLAGLRPYLFGDTVIASDDLTPLERDFLLVMDGIDPDTLQSGDAVRLSGRADGELVVRGRVGDLTATGLLALEDVVYGRLEVESGSLNLAEFTFPGRRLLGTLTAGTTSVYGRDFTSSQADLTLDQGRGTLSAAFVQGPTEDVRIRGSFETGEQETTWFLDEFTVRLEGDRWNLGGPAILRWGDDGYRLQNVRFVRPGVDGFRLVADGSVPRVGELDLQVSVRRLDLERMARLFQYEQRGLHGELDADLDIRGRAARPVVTGSVASRGFGWGSADLSLLAGQIRYEDRKLSGELLAQRARLPVMEISGTFPAALSFSDGFAFGVPEEPLDVSIQADSIPLEDILSFFPGYDRSEGWVDGQLRFGGTPSNLEPRGELRLVDGATSINAFGIRPEDVQSTFRLEPDGAVHVRASTTEGGDTVAVVTGTVTLNPVRDPAFDLTLSGNRFKAVGRRDVSGRVTGDVHLGGSYREPMIEGDLIADDGVLFIDEFVRSASVVDLFDTTFATMPAAERSNPFLQGLRADVSVSVGRNSWLRSRRFSQNMNVELSGQVNLVYVRSEKTIAMLGDLEAVRGTYTTVGRNFDVESGVVRFVGTPGVNPNLNFSASNRVRTPQGPLDIDATVTGTLLAPAVRLSSDDAALSESDLYGYLIFNRPTSALSRDQQALIQGATGFAVGTVFSQLGSLLTQDIPIDYLAISTSEFLDGNLGQGLPEAASTGVNIGKYFFDDIFVGVIWRPFGPQGGANRDSFSGRVEWRFRDGWSLDLFAEDRFLRESFTGFEQLSFDLSKVYGMFVLRQWGY